ncbi:hypothetical protein [Microvirga tunisiensis]|uniref:hypothetical protein n=1 Tax=Microvirga tunisiensis TaxID=2108360 RepID=UPI001FCF14D1|nr:hypothetical protein [Microvirga tunisiensis]
MKRSVFLNDTTLRDGAQAPGVAFTTAMSADEIKAIRAAGALRLPVRLTALAVSNSNWPDLGALFVQFHASAPRNIRPIQSCTTQNCFNE